MGQGDDNVQSVAGVGLLKWAKVKVARVVQAGDRMDSLCEYCNPHSRRRGKEEDCSALWAYFMRLTHQRERI